MGTGIGTILASIGIPMLLDAVMGKGLQVDSNRSRRLIPIKLPPQNKVVKCIFNILIKALLSMVLGIKLGLGLGIKNENERQGSFNRST